MFQVVRNGTYICVSVQLLHSLSLSLACLSFAQFKLRCPSQCHADRAARALTSRTDLASYEMRLGELVGCCPMIVLPHACAARSRALRLISFAPSLQVALDYSGALGWGKLIACAASVLSEYWL